MARVGHHRPPARPFRPPPRSRGRRRRRRPARPPRRRRGARHARSSAFRRYRRAVCRATASRRGVAGIRMIGFSRRGSGHDVCCSSGSGATRCPVRPIAGSVIIQLSCRGNSIFSRDNIAARGRRGGDVVFRVEQDHCIGPDRDDHRDGRGHPGGPARSSRSELEKPVYMRGRRRGQTAAARQEAARCRRTRADRAAARQGRSEEGRAGRQGLHRSATPSTRAGRTRSARICWASSRSTIAAVAELPVLRGAASAQGRKMGSGKTQQMALQAAEPLPKAPR